MRSYLFVLSALLPFLVAFSANAEIAKCSDSIMAKIREKGVEGNDQVKINCHVTLKKSDVITKNIIFEGAAASGVVFDCNGATIQGGSEDVLVVRSKKITDANGVISWERPEDVVIRNCEVRGSVRIRGMAPNGEGEFLRASSRQDDKHTERAQAAAPTRITLEKMTIIGKERTPLYIAPGSTYVTLKDSRVSGKSVSVAIYLDTESAHNIIQNNAIDTDTESRELIAVDASAKNRIVGNRFSSLNHGGIYLYRNCGEGGTIRHQAPVKNQIINNIFYYKNYGGGNPSVFVASRNGNRGYCNDDSGFPWGSSANNKDLARHNVIADNQIFALDPEKMIRQNDSPNVVMGNIKVSSSIERASGCYSFEEDRMVASGKSAITSKGEGKDQVCSKVTCNDGVFSSVTKVACPEARIIDFSCKMKNSNSGCHKEVACPKGTLIQDLKAACDLEMDSVSGSMASLPWNTLKVERASDNKRDGSCAIDDVKIKSGSAEVHARGETSVKVSCGDRDSNGGDCEIKGQLRCGS